MFCGRNLTLPLQSIGVVLRSDTILSISTFGEDEAGDLYVADYATGTIYQITSP
jgi:hypothetical protein